MKRALLLCVFLMACANPATRHNRTGTVTTDGSSTVYLITEAVAEEFMKSSAAARVTVGLSGTGGGFQRFCSGEADVNNASRTIEPAERQACEANGIRFVQLLIGYDGISVVVNPANHFINCLTVGELKRIWQPQSTVHNWSDVRAAFPARPMKLYAPGTASGTFDYFTETIVGKEDSSRGDYTASEDDNVLVQGIEGDRDGLGYFGYAYFKENAQHLRLVSIDSGSGCVAPSYEAIRSRAYKPLSRPLYIYVNHERLRQPHLRAFVDFYLRHAGPLITQVGYVPLAPAEYDSALHQLAGQ